VCGRKKLSLHLSQCPHGGIFSQAKEEAEREKSRKVSEMN
jgi:hypothetical protein